MSVRKRILSFGTICCLINVSHLLVLLQPDYGPLPISYLDKLPTQIPSRHRISSTETTTTSPTASPDRQTTIRTTKLGHTEAGPRDLSDSDEWTTAEESTTTRTSIGQYQEELISSDDQQTRADWQRLAGEDGTSPDIVSSTDQPTDGVAGQTTRYETAQTRRAPLPEFGSDDVVVVSSTENVRIGSTSFVYASPSAFSDGEEDVGRNTNRDDDDPEYVPSAVVSLKPSDGDNIGYESTTNVRLEGDNDTHLTLESGHEPVASDTESSTSPGINYQKFDGGRLFETTAGSVGHMVTATAMGEFPKTFVETMKTTEDPEITRLVRSDGISSERNTPKPEMTTGSFTEKLLTTGSDDVTSSASLQPTWTNSYEFHEGTTTIISEEGETRGQTSDTFRTENTKPRESTLAGTEAPTSEDPCLRMSCAFGAVCHEGSCRCRPSCRHEVAPICASNGRTYMSECDMRAHMCVERITLSVLANGPCSFTTTPRSLCADVVCRYGAACVRGQCRCPNTCPPLHAPVCGTDGKTYQSECLLNRVACIQKSGLRLRYRLACEDIPPITDVVIRETKQEDARLDDLSLLVIYVCVGSVICVTLIVVFVVVAVNRQSSDEETAPLTSKCTKSDMRISTSGSQQQQQRRITIEPRPDQDASSPCSTPIIPESGYTFTSGRLANGRHKRGIPVRSTLSSTDTSVVEMVSGDDVRIEIEMPEVTVSAVNRVNDVKRKSPCRRHTSVTESGVYEVTPEEAAILDDVFQHEEQLITRL